MFEIAERLQFERAMKDYKKVIRKLRLKAVAKYGNKANDWFGIK